jgi:hypothetical protein
MHRIEISPYFAPNNLIAVEIGYAPEKSKNCPWFVKSKNGLTSTFKSAEKLAYELRNTWNYPTAYNAVNALKTDIKENSKIVLDNPPLV